jgi:TorA maturation chaperone TorD
MSLAATLQGAAASRSQSWWLLSRLVLAAPDEALLLALARFFSDAAGGLGPELSPAVTAFADQARRLATTGADVEIAVEHARLFSGLSAKEGLPPVESAMREGRMLGGAAAAVAFAYAQAGFPDPLPEAGPPDHAAAELRFLALCCHAESQAWGEGDMRAASGWLVREREFLERHLADWFPAFCETAAPRAKLPLYSTGLALLATACRLDLEDVREMLAQVDRETALPQSLA